MKDFLFVAPFEYRGIKIEVTRDFVEEMKAYYGSDPIDPDEIVQNIKEGLDVHVFGEWNGKGN